MFFKNFAKSKGKQIYRSSFFDEVSGLQATTLLSKKRLRCKCFPVNFSKFLRTPFLTENLLTTASVDTKNSFKTEQRNHQEMLYVICDLPISAMSVIRNYLKI